MTRLVLLSIAILLMSAGTPLPISISKFTAVNTPSGTFIRWNSLDESYIVSFRIERTINGLDYQIMSEMLADGDSTYSRLIPHYPVKAYYRIGMIDLSGDLVYTPLVPVWGVSEPMVISVDGHKVSTNLRDTTAQYQLHDLNGNMVSSGLFLPSEGIKTCTKLCGLHILTLRQGDYMERLKVHTD